MKSYKLQITNISKYGRSICKAILLLFLLASAANANISVDPMQLGVGARSLAMGRASVVAPGDVNAMFENPANAGGIKKWSATSMYTSLMEDDIKYTLLGGAGQAFGGTLGLAYLGGFSSGIAGTTRDADSRIAPSGDPFNYSSSTIKLVYGRQFNKDFSAGAALKYLSKDFSGRASGYGFNIDVGMLSRINEKLSIGFAAQNIMTFGLNWNTGASDYVQQSVKTGLAYKIKEDVLIVSDIDIYPFGMHLGAEWTPVKFLAIRAGAENVRSGSSSQTNFGLGAGVNFKGVSFDYAYYKDGVVDVNNTHFFTVSFKPEPEKIKEPEKKPEQSKEIKKKPAPAPSKKLPAKTEKAKSKKR